MNSLGLFPFMKRLDFYDLDNINLESGIYGLNNSINNNAPSNNSSGILLGAVLIFNGNNLSIGGNPIVQIVVDYSIKTIKIRTYWVTKWYDWKSVSLA